MSHDQLIKTKNFHKESTDFRPLWSLWAELRWRDQETSLRWDDIGCSCADSLIVRPECGLINKNDEEFHLQQSHSQKSSCLQSKREISYDPLSRWLCLSLPEYCSPTKVSSISAKTKRKIRWKFDKKARSFFDLTFFPEQRFEPVQDFVDDGEHDADKKPSKCEKLFIVKWTSRKSKSFSPQKLNRNLTTGFPSDFWNVKTVTKI